MTTDWEARGRNVYAGQRPDVSIHVCTCSTDAFADLIPALRASHDRLLAACEKLVGLSESEIFKGSDAHLSLEDSDAVALARAALKEAPA